MRIWYRSGGDNSEVNLRPAEFHLVTAGRSVTSRELVFRSLPSRVGVGNPSESRSTRRHILSMTRSTSSTQIGPIQRKGIHLGFASWVACPWSMKVRTSAAGSKSRRPTPESNAQRSSFTPEGSWTKRRDAGPVGGRTVFRFNTESTSEFPTGKSMVLLLSHSSFFSSASNEHEAEHTDRWWGTVQWVRRPA